MADDRAEAEFAYQQLRDQEKDRQWQAEFDEDLRRYELENAPVATPAYSPQPQPETMSQAGEDFLKNLPYAPAGSSEAAWKKLVSQRLEGALTAGKITATDAKLLKEKLKLS